MFNFIEVTRTCVLGLNRLVGNCGCMCGRVKNLGLGALAGFSVL
jgi:hypothetical protein